MTSDDRAFEFELEQHRSLRIEVIQAMQDANQIMTFGLPAVGLVASGGLAARNSALGFFLFTVLVPVVSLNTISLWCAAQQRLARASHFLSGVEERISLLCSRAGPTWESWLRSGGAGTGTHHIWAPEAAALTLFYGTTAASLVLGTITSSDILLFWRLLAAACVTAVSIASFISIRRRFKQVRTLLLSTFTEPVHTGASVT